MYRAKNKNRIYFPTHFLTSFFSFFFFSPPSIFSISICFFSLIFGLMAAGCCSCEDIGLGLRAPLDTEMCLCRELLMLHWRLWLSLPARLPHGRFVCSLIVSNTFCWLRSCLACTETPWRDRLSWFPSRLRWWYCRVPLLSLRARVREALSLITLFLYLVILLPGGTEVTSDAKSYPWSGFTVISYLMLQSPGQPHINS